MVAYDEGNDEVRYEKCAKMCEKGVALRCKGLGVWVKGVERLLEGVDHVKEPKGVANVHLARQHCLHDRLDGRLFNDGSCPYSR